jgi:hypothetical protein
VQSHDKVEYYADVILGKKKKTKYEFNKLTLVETRSEGQYYVFVLHWFGTLCATKLGEPRSFSGVERLVEKSPTRFDLGPVLISPYTVAL